MHLETFVKEKVCIKAGQEFGHLEGYTLIINKALCGMRASGPLWHERLSNCLRDMGHEPRKMEPDVSLRNSGEHHECISTYVDDLLIASKDLHSVVDSLTIKHHFKLKDTGPMSYHLG